MALRRLQIRGLCGRLQTSRCVLPRTSSTASSESIDIENVRSFDELPSPGGLYDVPYLGTAFFFKPFTQYTASKVHLLFREFYNKYGDIMKFRAGKDWMVLLFNPDYIQKICMEPIKSPYRPPLQILLSYYKRKNTSPSLGSLNGEEWATFRKPAQDQILKPTMVANYVPLINDVATDFVTKLKTMKSITCLDEFYRYTTESVGMLCFNRRLGCLYDEPSDLNIMPNIQQFFSLLNKSSYAILHPYVYFRTPMYNKFETSADAVYGLVRRMIENIKDEAIKQSAKNDPTEGPVKEEPNLLKTLLMDPRLTPDKTAVLLQDLFVGGVDSTSNAMTFLLFNLSKWPEKQEKLFEEISSKVSKDQPVTKDVLANVPYLKACVKENFRLYHPIAGGSIRVFDHDMIVGGYVIPKKTTIVAAGSTISLLDRYYTNPHDFIPERWIRDSDLQKQNKINSFGQLPFGFGIRSCIGQRFAENEIYVAMIKMIRNFRFKLPSDMKNLDYEYQLFATPKQPVTLLIEQR